MNTENDRFCYISLAVLNASKTLQFCCAITFIVSEEFLTNEHRLRTTNCFQSLKRSKVRDL